MQPWQAALTINAARGAAVLYVVALARVLKRSPTPRDEIEARCAWSFACLLWWLHAAAALAWWHGGSWSAAEAHVAERTAEFTGLRWGGGLYFNVATVVLWTTETIAWWRSGRFAATRLSAAVQVYLAFMVFNATVVFGPPATRIVAGFATLLLAALWIRQFRKKDQPR